MKKPTLFNIVSYVVIIIILAYFIPTMKKNNAEFDKVTQELKEKTNTIKLYDAERAKLKADKAKSEVMLDTSIKENKALRGELNKKPRIKIVYKDKIIEVIKFEKLEDCQYDLKLCMDKSWALEKSVIDFTGKVKKLELNEKKLNHEISGKMILLENERENYKKYKRKSTIEKIGLAIIGLILVIVK